MTTSDLLTPAEVAALFRVDPKTVTRWAKDARLTSVRTLGGHRRYRAAEVYALLDSERWSGRHAPVTTLVNDHYDGDPARALRDLACRYGISITILDRAWFTQTTGRDLTDAEWELIATELATSSNALHDACAGQLSTYANAALSAAGIAAGPTTGPNPSAPCPIPPPGKTPAGHAGGAKGDATQPAPALARTDR